MNQRVVQGVVQQNELDNVFSTATSHSDDYVSHKYCLLDDRNIHKTLPYWVQGLGQEGGGDGDFYVNCNYQDKAVCDLLDSKTDSYKAQWVNPDFNAGDPPASTSIGDDGGPTPNSKGGQILCTWPQDNFKNIEWTDHYLQGISKGYEYIGGNRFRPPDSKIIQNTRLYTQNRQIVYRTFCNQTLKKENEDYRCPMDLQTCSYYKATPKNSDDLSPQAICSTYEQVDENGFDNDVNSFCNSENATEDCWCVNPELDPTIKKLFDEIGEASTNLLSSVGCWYIPCGLDDSYILNKSRKHQRSNCELEPICNEIINAVAGGNIDINDIRTNIRCNFDGNGNGNGFTTTQITIGIIVVLLIIIVFVILIYFTS
jgi:hypothetical protein